MSLYKKSWFFTLWMVVLVLAFPFWLPLFEKLIGPFGWVVGMAFFIAQGLIASYGFYCPNCGLSTFQSKKGLLPHYSIIPRRKCGHCGRDHTRSE